MNEPENPTEPTNPTPRELHPKLFVKIFRGVNQDFYWSAHSHANHKSMAIGGEGYRRRTNCIHGVQTVFGDIAIFQESTDSSGKTHLERIR